MNKTNKKYIAFNPASSNREEWYADSLKEMTQLLRSIETIGSLQKIRRGLYTFADLEIYDLRKNPKLLEEMKNWTYEGEN